MPALQCRYLDSKALEQDAVASFSVTALSIGVLVSAALYQVVRCPFGATANPGTRYIDSPTTRTACCAGYRTSAAFTKQLLGT